MSEEKYIKSVFVWRIVAVLSLITVLTVVIAAANIENWNDAISTALRILSRVSSVCFGGSIFGIAILQQKRREQKINDRINELEQEIKQLKKN